mgnify:CR=1 FL=1
MGLLKNRNMDTIRKIINELKLTEWPTGKDLFQLTVYTVILCAIIALIILGADLVYQWGLTQFLNFEF